MLMPYYAQFDFYFDFDGLYYNSGFLIDKNNNIPNLIYKLLNYLMF